MDLWRKAIAQVVTDSPVQVSLGTFKTNGHKLWEWRVLESHGSLFWQNWNRVKVYGHIRWGRYTHLHTSRSGRMRGVIAKVDEITPGTVKVCSVASPPMRSIPLVDSLDVLHGWGQTWI